MERAYAAIGRAVYWAQVFEVALIPIYEFYKMRSDAAYLDKTAGYIPAGAFKVPIRNIVKALSENGEIAPDLEARLNRYAEDRHTLIHRWIIQNGMPDAENVESFRPLVELANRVEREAKLLIHAIAGYVVKYGNPEWVNDNAEEYEHRMRRLFHDSTPTSEGS